jgi:hypothetical protein
MTRCFVLGIFAAVGGVAIGVVVYKIAEMWGY